VVRLLWWKRIIMKEDKYDNITYISDCCGAYAWDEIQIYDDLVTGRCSKCKDGTGFHDEREDD